MAAFTASSNSSPSVADCAGSSQTKVLSDLPIKMISQNLQGNLRTVPSKGRFASKLSSRHNRRKRRERESKDPSAKKSRGAGRSRDQVPIPSFAPITTESCRGEVGVRVEDNTGVSEKVKPSSPACSDDRDSDTTKQVADNAAVKAVISMNSNSTNQIYDIEKTDSSHGNDKLTDKTALTAAPVQKQKLNHISDGRRATEIQQDQNEKNAFGEYVPDPAGNSRPSPQISKQKKSSKDPSEIASKTSTSPSTLETEPRKDKEQPSLQPAAKQTPSYQCFPETVERERSEAGNQQKDLTRDENNPGGGRAKRAGRKISKMTENQPRNETSSDQSEMSTKDPPRDTDSNLGIEVVSTILSMKEGKSSTLNESGGPAFVNLAKKMKKMCRDQVGKSIDNGGERANERAQYISSAKSDPSDENKVKISTLSGSSPSVLVDQARNENKTTRDQDKRIGNDGNKANKCSKYFGFAKTDPSDEHNSGGGKVKGVAEGTCSDLNDYTRSHSQNKNPNDRAETQGCALSKGNGLDLEMGTLPIKLSTKKGNSLTSNEPCSPPFIQQDDAKQEMGSDTSGKDKAAHAVGRKSKHSKNVGLMKKSSPPEVIEIFDDEEEGDVAVEVTPNSKKGQVLNKSTTHEKTSALGKKGKPKKSNQKRKKRKEPVSISRSSSDSGSGDELIYDAKRAKRKREGKGPTNRKKSDTAKQSKTSADNNLCFACSSCKCSSRAGSAFTPQKTSSLSGSDARQEQSLVNRLQRIERDIAWKEGQRNNVARELKKRRGQMLKKWESQSSNSKAQRPRFLADADNIDELVGSCSKKSSKEVNRAQSLMFGKQKKHQPTLTQIIRGTKEEDDDENSCTGSNAKSNCDEDAPGNVHATGLPGGDDDFLAFWDDSAPVDHSNQCVGSMNYFNRAVANVKDKKCTSKWAKATANTLQIEEDEGFDALVDLFDASIEKNNSHECIGCSQDLICDDDDDCVSDGSPNLVFAPLSPNGKRVAKDIESSVDDDPRKLAAIERMCPNWKENIQLAQVQTDPDDLNNALQNVQKAKTDLENMKEKILQAFFDRHQTLKLYEKSLQSSINRLSGNENEDDGL